MALPITVTRSISFNYHDHDLEVGDDLENIEVVIQELSDGSIRMKRDGEVAHCSLEFMAQWAYTLNNWKNRLKKDVVRLSDLE